jgi:hypothetical protein
MIDGDGTDILDLSRDRLSKGECIAIGDDLLGMDCFDGAERHGLNRLG